MSDPDPKTIVIAVVGLIAFIIFLSSPLGDLLMDILGFIPWLIWKWILGILALFVVIGVIRYLLD